MAKRERHEHVPITISLAPEINQRLRRYASQRHSTVSGLITQWILDQPVKDEPVPAKTSK